MRSMRPSPSLLIARMRHGRQISDVEKAGLRPAGQLRAAALIPIGMGNGRTGVGKGQRERRAMGAVAQPKKVSEFRLARRPATLRAAEALEDLR